MKVLFLLFFITSLSQQANAIDLTASLSKNGIDIDTSISKGKFDLTNTITHCNDGRALEDGQYICAGDTVVSKKGLVGEVIGVNTHSYKTAVRWHTTANGYGTNKRTTEDTENLSIDKGCLTYFCIGNTVVSGNGFTGKVIGVNPNSLEIAVRWHTNSNGTGNVTRSVFKAVNLSISRGCLGHFCQDDTVVSEDGRVGKVIGVNPNSSKVAVSWHTTANGYGTNKRQTLNAETLAIGRGCVYGLCVKDTVVSGNGFTGEVIGLNPHTSRAAVRWRTNSNGNSNDTRSTFSIDNLFIQKYCDLYDYSTRDNNIYISLKGEIEIEGFDLRFTWKH
jgi:preprotein translocase subunit YajC